MKRVLLGLAVVACLATPVVAQDSVSKFYFDGDPNTQGLPGDALDPWTTGPVSFQSQAYVVDLTPFTGSWGTRYAVAPLIKGSKTQALYFNTMLSAQSISRLQQQQLPFASAYATWTTPGFGIHPTNNLTPNATRPAGSSTQFAVTFAEFGSLPSRYNGIIGGLINYDPTQPNKLYVRRVVAAISGCSDTADVSQFGTGAIDERGNVLFRADANGSTGGCNLTTLAGNNIFQVDLAARNPLLTNIVSNAGLGDAASGNWVVVNDAQVHSCPNIGPTAIFADPPKPGPFYLGTNFLIQFKSGAVDGAPAVSVKPHLAAGLSDQRGSLSYMSKNFPCLQGSTCGTAATLAYATGATAATALDVFGLDALGTPMSPTAYLLPATISDPTDPMTFTTAAMNFDHYHGSTAFRASPSQVALNVDQAGRMLAAATVYAAAGNASPYQFIAVLRVNPQTCQTEWSVAAYNCDGVFNPTMGKPIYAGPTGPAIGRLVPMYDIPGAPQGPSMSAPMIDAVGNVWLLASTRLWGKDRLPDTADDDLDTALVRAVYDSATFGYRLEYVFGAGDTFAGQNSGLPWRIFFLQIAGSTSVNPATAWSQNISEKAFLGGDASPNLATSAPDGLGGLVLYASIVYDVNGDGKYIKSTGTGGDPTSPDEDYNVLLYVAANPETAPPVTCGDANCDGAVNNGDIDAFVMALTNQAVYVTTYGCLPNCDTNCDTLVNNGDIDTFVAAVLAGGCQCQ